MPPKRKNKSNSTSSSTSVTKDKLINKSKLKKSVPTLKDPHYTDIIITGDKLNHFFKYVSLMIHENSGYACTKHGIQAFHFSSRDQQDRWIHGFVRLYFNTDDLNGNFTVEQTRRLVKDLKLLLCTDVWLNYPSLLGQDHVIIGEMYTELFDDAPEEFKTSQGPFDHKHPENQL